MDNLIIFDFDNTLIDGNTDMVVLDLAPHLKLRRLTKDCGVEGKGWGEAMCLALEQLYIHGLKQNNIDDCILQLDFFGHIQNLIFKLKNFQRSDVIIISHSNEYFVNMLLKKADMVSAFKGIHTYPAHWTKQGCLRIGRYHDEDVVCEYCPLDFCKGHVLSKLIKQMQLENGNHYKKTIFVGDGMADFCAASQLKGEEDYVICRDGYKLHYLINSCANNIKADSKLKFAANHICWNTGRDIYDAVLSII